MLSRSSRTARRSQRDATDGREGWYVACVVSDAGTFVEANKSDMNPDGSGPAIKDRPHAHNLVTRSSTAPRTRPSGRLNDRAIHPSTPSQSQTAGADNTRRHVVPPYIVNRRPFCVASERAP